MPETKPGKAPRAGTPVIGSVILIALTMFAALFLVRRNQPITSLAVLPLTNVGGDSNTEYLSDGISDSVIRNLSQVSNLKVIPLTSVLRYKRQQVDPRTIGRELKVRAVLIGKLIKREDGLSISTELIDIRDNNRIWGEQYDGKVADILGLQSEIAREISGKLRLTLSGEDQQQLTKRHTANSEAYQLYLQGRFSRNKYTDQGLKESIEYYKLAVEKDPKYALAHAGLADSYVQLGIDFFVEDAVPRARTHAARALELDDTLAEAHLSLAEIKLFHDRDQAAAEKELRRAIELQPNYATSLLNNPQQALGCTYAAAGNKVEALKIIHELEEKISTGMDPYLLAPIYALLGDKDRAFAWLEQAYIKRSFRLAFLKSEATLESLRSDARFADLVRRIGNP
ncbi:MAG TPA: hypothetical protein VE422_24515 [Terriglobia bacterium]|nr:hypothetical protein [Terriglobia bacterium]